MSGKLGIGCCNYLPLCLRDVIWQMFAVYGLSTWIELSFRLFHAPWLLLHQDDGFISMCGATRHPVGAHRSLCLVGDNSQETEVRYTRCVSLVCVPSLVNKVCNDD